MRLRRNTRVLAVAGLLIGSLVGLGQGASARAQTQRSDRAPTAGGAQSLAAPILDRMAAHERDLVRQLQRLTPRVETYLQDFRPDDLGREIPYSDRYYLGRLVWRRGEFQTISFLNGHDASPDWLTPMGPISGGLAAPLTHLFHSETGDGGDFARMIFPDARHFDRAHYRFAFVRREFLGEIRCLVFDVAPRGRGNRGFWGRIWIEDEGDFLVRFNGSFYRPRPLHPDVHFDAWRVNVAPDLWVPDLVYSEESDYNYGLVRSLRFRAMTRLWGYNLRLAGNQEALTEMQIEGGARDPSAQAHDLSPVASMRAWQRQAEDNILDRLERAGLLAPAGAVDKVLDTVADNLVLTNHLQLDPPVRCRVLLTTPLESMSIGHTIVLSRGLIDTLPTEASLAAVLAHELGHIALGQGIDDDYAFSDRMLFPDRDVFQVVRLRRPVWQEQQADAKAMQILKNSPYKNELGQAGLYLRALLREAGEAHLVGSQLSNGLFVDGYLDRLTALLPGAPKLQPGRLSQVPALPLGAWVHLDPWTDQLTLETAPRPKLLSIFEKMPFQVTPLFPYLRRVPPVTAGNAPPPPAPGVPSSEAPPGAAVPSAAAAAADPQRR